MKWPDGTIYEGLWDNNLYNGRGKLWHASGDLYEGDDKSDPNEIGVCNTCHEKFLTKLMAEK